MSNSIQESYPPFGVSDGINTNDEAEDLEESCSASASIFDYPYENGRRYHAFRAGRYLLPNDEIEQERLDLAQSVWLLINDSLVTRSPLEQPERILDLGTGTGNWAIEAGDLYPEAEVIGVDLSPIMSEFVPPNVRFEVDDIEDRWLWKKDSFGLIHGRSLSGAIQNWEKLLQNSYDHLCPGGYLEFQEIDMVNPFTNNGNSLKAGSPLMIYTELLHEASIRNSSQLDVASELGIMMERMGFVDVRCERQELPVRVQQSNQQDSKRSQIAKYALPMLQMSIEAYGMALLTRMLNMSELEARVIMKKAEDDMLESEGSLSYNAYDPPLCTDKEDCVDANTIFSYFIFGRKPEARTPTSSPAKKTPAHVHT
ncbi:S-adenosyl-L-methionine-dependent methyltransferase [Ascobolus immersus RN42]|uniref:S-adenosyl-L-methionine-dependent methyltransferase n=1 Tax=Ascobolus immersus RN42 TaxID=1160509 RepID=A0A3N4IHQ5_ASCIM|nr:S-adenosyl-L-methionine-dependent methyltransferase [Ascobolus immersus RN42]